MPHVDMADSAEAKPVAPTISTSGTNKAKSHALEQQIISGQPVETFSLPSGKRLRVFPKPQGYFYKIDEAIADYLVALVHQERLRSKSVWFRAINTIRRRLAVDKLERSKYEVLRLIFADEYTPQRHTELTVEEYLTMPHDLVVAILDAFRRANDVSDILRVLIPDYDKKKELQNSVTGRNTMRI